MNIDWITWVAAFAIGALGTGRLARAIYHDDFPPSIWFRIQWDKLTEGSSWNMLFHCPWCVTHWIAALCLGWFILGIFWVPAMIAWWVFFGWFALSYVASMIIVRDEPEE
jgi:hypothetical protein